MAEIGPDPEDFVVEELPLYAPEGRGEHTFVRVEKRDRDTEAVAGWLAALAGCARRDVGYAGRKDRNAVATQWLSVPGLAPERALDASTRGIRVLEAVAHGHRLRTGQLRGNRFAIRMLGVDEAGLRAARGALDAAEREGIANAFGAQRFGRDGRNAERGRALLEGERSRGDRRAARFALSALQSALFNAVLAERPRPLARLEAGDLAVVHASGGLFEVTDPAREQPRADAFEISPTGPIFGRRAPLPSGEPARRETAARAALGIPPDSELPRLRGLRLRGARRALRLRIAAASLERAGANAVLVRFELPRGSYATVCIEALFGEGAARRATRPGMTPDGGSRTLDASPEPSEGAS